MEPELKSATDEAKPTRLCKYCKHAHPDGVCTTKISHPMGDYDCMCPQAAYEDGILLRKNEELGKAILGEARVAYHEERKKKVLGEVQRLLTCKDEAAEKIRFFTESQAWYQRKIDAIEAGEFDFNISTGLISFHDQELQRANF